MAPDDMHFILSDLRVRCDAFLSDLWVRCDAFLSDLWVRSELASHIDDDDDDDGRRRRRETETETTGDGDDDVCDGREGIKDTTRACVGEYSRAHRARRDCAIDVRLVLRGVEHQNATFGVGGVSAQWRWRRRCGRRRRD